MDIPKIGALQSTLTSAAAGAVKGPEQASGFLELLKVSLDKVNETQNQAETTAKQFQLNEKGVTLEDAVVAMQKANVSFQAAVQVRNKLVAAYHDIMNMQI